MSDKKLQVHSFGPRPPKEWSYEELSKTFQKRMADLAVMQMNVNLNSEFTEHDREAFQQRIRSLVEIGHELSNRGVPVHFDASKFHPEVQKIFGEELSKRGFTKSKPVGREIKPKSAGRKIKPLRKRRLLK